MAKARPRQRSVIGRLSLAPPNALVPALVTFLQRWMAAWRAVHVGGRTQNENVLNYNLCTFLAAQARHELFVVTHQAPQTTRHSSDLAIHEIELVAVTGYNPVSCEPFYVLEGKRLPAPRADRAEEYVWGTAPNRSPCGGIQRFKRCLHGHAVRAAGIIGYIQTQDSTHWHAEINSWIRARSNRRIAEETWGIGDTLQSLDTTTPVPTTTSTHRRSGNPGPVTPEITLHHFFIELP